MPPLKSRKLQTFPPALRRFGELTPAEVLALAIHTERANTRRFRAFAGIFRGYDEEVARRFEELAQEEQGHEERLLEEFQRRFGDTIPPVDETDVDVVIESPDLDDAEHQIFDSLKPARVYELALQAEHLAREFYLRAAAASHDPQLIHLYKEFAQMEGDHVAWVEQKIAPASGAGAKAGAIPVSEQNHEPPQS